MKTFKKILSVFLAFVMVITVIPMSVYAAESEKPAKIEVQELEEYRDEYSKTFETSEGTNVVISAAVPIHYENGGELVEIDNTLMTSDNDNSMLTNKDNSYSVELPKKYKDDSTITLSSDDNEISFSILNDVNKSKGVKYETDEIEVDETDAESVAYAESNLDKLSSSITYSDVIENTDIEYVVEPNQLKENIVINDMVDENYSVSYELNLGNLIAVKNDDNSISIKDADNKEIYLIESPYMYDANDNVSYDISVDLTKTDVAYVLTYTPDYAWLSSKNCSYPVTIDPTIKIRGNNVNKKIEDTFVNTNILSGSLSTQPELNVSKSTNMERFAYFDIRELPQIPDNVVLTDISLNLHTTSRVASGNKLALFEIDSNGVPDSFISSVNGSNFIEPISEPIDIKNAPTSAGEIKFNLTKIHEQLFSSSHNIFLLKSVHGNSNIKITAAETGNNVPTVCIEYMSFNGIDENFKYTNCDLGLSGNAFINELTGELTIEKTLFTSNGSAKDITLYLGNNVNTPPESAFGQNASLNYYKTLTIDNVDNDVQYVVTNGDGSLEYLYSDSYEINDSTSDTITVKYTQNHNTIIDSYIIDTIAHNYEDQFYVLSSIETIKNNADSNADSHSSFVNLTYDEFGCLYLIEDELNIFEFSYDEYGLVSVSQTSNSNNEIPNSNKFIDNSLSFIEYEFSNSENGINITLGNGYQNSSNIFYEITNNNVSRVSDENGLSYEFKYDSNNRIVKLQEISSDDNSGEFLSFSYGLNRTTISNKDYEYTEYFDNEGNLVSIIDQDGNATFAQYEGNLISKLSKTRNSARNIANFYNFESTNECFFTLVDGSNNYINLSTDKKITGNSSVEFTINGNNETFVGSFDNLDCNSYYTVSLWVYLSNSSTCSLQLSTGGDEGIFRTVTPMSNISGWQQLSCTIKTLNTNSINIAICGINTSPSNTNRIFVDNMCIQKSPYLTNKNLINNGDFSNSENNFFGWTSFINGNENASNIEIVSVNDNISTADNNCLKINGDYLNCCTVEQNVPIEIRAKGTKYTYGGWIKTVNAIYANDSTDSKVSLSVYDNNNNLLDEVTLSTYNLDWQYIEREITLPNDNCTSLKFVINYNYQTGYALFDGLSLSQDELFSICFEYNYGENNDDVNTITGIIINGNTIDLGDSNSTIELSQCNYDCTYDDFGNKKTETYYIEDENHNICESIISKFNYSNSDVLLTGELSELGRWINYKYDYFGNVSSVVDANGNKVEYEYDNFQNLSAIINEFESNYVSYASRNDDTDDDPPVPETVENYKQRVEYSYTGNRLDTIETLNDSNRTQNKYEFTYDEWNNLIEIKVNDATYIEYEYNCDHINDDNDYYVNYHQLNSIKYANGQTINYVYDDDGNIIYEYDSSNNNNYHPTLEYSYYYYDDGTCYGKKDLIAETIETYQDGLTTVCDYDGNIIHKYGYDSNGNLLEQIGNTYFDIKGKTTSNTSVLETSINNKLSNVISTEYDDFGRVKVETISVPQESEDEDNNLSEGEQSTPKPVILKEYTYYTSDDIDNDASTLLYEWLGLDVENLGAVDEGIDTTRLVRYLTYYIVDTNNVKTKLNEYRYLYYPNGNTLSYTVVSGGNDNTPGSNQDSAEDLRLYAYNSSNMLTGYVADFSLDRSPNGILTLNINSILYDYDENGNIINVRANDIDKSNSPIKFSYDGSDSGTALNNCLTDINLNFGEEFNVDFDLTYDAVGNINTVSSNNLNIPINNNFSIDVNSVNLNWSRGSTLDSIKGNINVNYKLPLINTNLSVPVSLDLFKYKYDDNNIRTSKSINLSFVDKLNPEVLSAIGTNASRANLATADIDYIWRDGLLVGEKIECSGTIFEEGDSSYDSGAGSYNIIILYDENDNAYGFTITKTIDDETEGLITESETFYYLKDADNTINAIINSNGEAVVEYSYDSYGMVLNIKNAPGYRFLMLLNPLAYRDYIYDIESGMYYLHSRYYAPYIGRFISADSMLDTGSGTSMCTNLYSYCENDPINRIDPTGHWAQNYKGFKWTSTGFNLYVNYAFVNKSFCRTYAADILYLKKTLFYKGMSLTRIAAELYFHAIVYYASNALTKIGVNNKTISSWKKSAYYMEINNNDNRVAYFYALWGLSNATIGMFL